MSGSYYNEHYARLTDHVSPMLYDKGILNDEQIRYLCQGNRPMIEPFVDQQIEEGKLSFGLSSFGYDVRCAEEFLVFSNARTSIIDPKNFDREAVLDVSDIAKKNGYVTIPPNSFLLTRSLEYFRMPDDIVALYFDKSTYARCGLTTIVAPIEPGWEGHLTIEVINSTNIPVRVYANEGIIQVMFFRGYRPSVIYREKKAKYQNQKSVTFPKVVNG